MPLTIIDYRGYRVSLYSSDAGHSALVHKAGVILGFARSSRKEGLGVAFQKVRAMVDEALPASSSRNASAGLRQRGIDRLRR